MSFVFELEVVFATSSVEWRRAIDEKDCVIYVMFFVTDTFDADVDPVLELEIQDHKKKIISLREANTTEVTTA